MSKVDLSFRYVREREREQEGEREREREIQKLRRLL